VNPAYKGKHFPLVESVFSRHRGPFKLLIIRQYSKKKNPFRSEWLEGVTEAEDVEAEAQSLLQDPRDTIESVGVFSERENQFVMSYRRDNAEAA